MMFERMIDNDIKLIPYYRNDAVSLPWYQNLEVCRQVDNKAEAYTLERLHRMYDYLNHNGECYYIEFKENLVGDISLANNGKIAIVVSKPYQNLHIGRRCVLAILQLAKEKNMDRVTANIYNFNKQSQKMFEVIGFKKTSMEWYEFKLSLLK